MEPRCSAWTRVLFTAAAVMVASHSPAAETLNKTEKIAGTIVEYKVILPNGYDLAKAYPAVLAFPGGPQTMDTVEGTVERNWQNEAPRRGYIVVVPAAPGNELFFEGGD